MERPPSYRPSRPTAVVRDERFLAHLHDAEQWESRRRLEQIHAMLDHLNGNPPLTRLTARSATQADLELVHTAAYIQQVAQTADHSHSRLTADTYASAESYGAAILAAGGVMSAIDAVVAGHISNAFVLSRPPGHHAEAGRAGGFCLFNNVALGAQYARTVLGLSKVLIVDWDVHHGNGIQHIFEHDPTVLYFSTHQYPLYPGTGHYVEVGRGRGEGFNINVPLGRGMGDGEFVALFEHLLKPVAFAFDPDLVMVAAGFDIHKKDPLGRMKVTETGFGGLTRILMDIAARCCQGRLVLVLEGGYHHKALADSVRAVLAELCDQTCTDVAKLCAEAKVRRIKPVIARCTRVLERFWPCLGAGVHP